MNPAKQKIESLRSAAACINQKNRREVVVEKIRPELVILKSKWNHFSVSQEVFHRHVGTLETWATEIWKRTDYEMKVGKFLAELQKLEACLKT